MDTVPHTTDQTGQQTGVATYGRHRATGPIVPGSRIPVLRAVGLRRVLAGRAEEYQPRHAAPEQTGSTR